MYELNIQADNELKEFIVSVKGTDDKFVSIAVAVAIDYLYRSGCPDELIQRVASINPETRKGIAYAMKQCFIKREKIINWGYTPYDKEHQHKPMKDCLEVLQRCNALILSGNWRESRGCNQEYAAAYVMDMQIYEMKPTGEICSVE